MSCQIFFEECKITGSLTSHVLLGCFRNKLSHSLTQLLQVHKILLAQIVWYCCKLNNFTYTCFVPDCFVTYYKWVMTVWTETHSKTCLKWWHVTVLFLMCAVPILTYKLTTISFLLLLCSSFSQTQVKHLTLHHDCFLLHGAGFRYFWAK